MFNLLLLNIHKPSLGSCEMQQKCVLLDTNGQTDKQSTNFNFQLFHLFHYRYYYSFSVLFLLLNEIYIYIRLMLGI